MTKTVRLKNLMQAGEYKHNSSEQGPYLENERKYKNLA